MKTYWDSSALIELLHDSTGRLKLSAKTDATRTHTLAEVFSTLTKGVNYRYSPQDAARMVEHLAEDLDLLELSRAEALSVIKQASRMGVRGARIHDSMHAAAARSYGADILMTLDLPGFSGLAPGIKIQSL
jgi:predicted nucleic acid-binding protein